MEQRREETTLTNSSIFQGDSSFPMRQKPSEYLDTEEEKTSVRLQTKKRKALDALSLLQAKAEEAQSRRIESYEVELYRASVTFHEIFTVNVALRSVETLHHIYILREEHEELSPAQLDELNFEIDAVTVDHPAAAREYRLISQLLALASALMAKWGLLDFKNYLYRQTAMAMKTPMIDLEVMSDDVFTMETLWLSSMVQVPPLSALLDESVRQFAIVLQQEATKLFTTLCQVNEGDREGLAALEAQLAKGKTEVELVRLEMPGKWVPFCCWGHDGHIVKGLSAKLRDFDLVYRSFEQSLIGALLGQASH